MGKSRKSKSATVPIHGDMAHNTGFLLGIGGLVVNWANNESVFLAMLQALLGANHRTVAIVWHSHRTTVGRLELISRLARDRIEDETLVADIDRAIIRFKGACRTRNFFCHATYDYDSEMRLQSAHGITLTQDGDPISFVYKPMEAATLNEIIDASMKLTESNLDNWRLVLRLENALGAPHTRLPQQLREALYNEESHHPKNEAPEHE